MDSNNSINFIITIVGGVIASVCALIIEYWIIQPSKDGDWWKKLATKTLMQYFTAVLSLIIPVLIARDYLVSIISRLPAESDARLNVYATLLAVIAAIWGVFWGTLIRPRLFSFSQKSNIR